MANAAARSADGLASVHVHHVNLQPFVGGGEVYVHALTRALLQADATVTLYVHPQNRFWDDLPVRRVLVEDAESLEPALPEVLPTDRSLLFVHTRVPEDMAKRLAARHALVGFSHNPMFEREPGWPVHAPGYARAVALAPQLTVAADASSGAGLAALGRDIARSVYCALREAP